ncbi:hypothetical protein DY000_02046673 [Brassica cretica]|uniref:Uncharacterized protein n=1 Tax=Brassica cretica TaxID=69181 RepID=A0ABQ7EZM1_BRACR|nr:hypothetical protein DY000_02035641 [Brassica cretica]KAF3608269.1 hypothetical protein DY000_02046673 [Brassica cretica]
MSETAVHGGVIDEAVADPDCVRHCWEEEVEDYMLTQKIVYGVTGSELSSLCPELGLPLLAASGI